MQKHFEHEIDKLKHSLFSLCAKVEENVRMAVEAVEKRNSLLAKRVIENDVQIDQMEVDVEEECLKILALHQPVAVDLRFVVGALKINNDLERIGDLAGNIAERALVIADQDKVGIPIDLTGMVKKSQDMLRNSLDAFVNMDVPLAKTVCAADDEVDDLNRDMFELLAERVKESTKDINALLSLLSVSRHIERIADHATNIAEDVIYMVEGEIVRHSGGQN